MAPFRRIEQLRQVGSVGVSVLERVVTRIPPDGDCLRVCSCHCPDPEVHDRHIADSTHATEGSGVRAAVRALRAEVCGPARLVAGDGSGGIQSMALTAGCSSSGEWGPALAASWRCAFVGDGGGGQPVLSSRRLRVMVPPSGVWAARCSARAVSRGEVLRVMSLQAGHVDEHV
jgi:hypothetical protein